MWDKAAAAGLCSGFTGIIRALGSDPSIRHGRTELRRDRRLPLLHQPLQSFGPPARCEPADSPHPSNRLRFQVTGRRRAAARDGAVRRRRSVHARLLIKWERAPAKLQRAIIHLPPQITQSAHVSLCRSITEGRDRLLRPGVRAASRRASTALRRIITLTSEFPHKLWNHRLRDHLRLFRPLNTRERSHVSGDSSAATLRASDDVTRSASLPSALKYQRASSGSHVGARFTLCSLLATKLEKLLTDAGSRKHPT